MDFSAPRLSGGALGVPLRLLTGSSAGPEQPPTVGRLVLLTPAAPPCSLGSPPINSCTLCRSRVCVSLGVLSGRASPCLGAGRRDVNADRSFKDARGGPEAVLGQGGGRGRNREAGAPLRHRGQVRSKGREPGRVGAGGRGRPGARRGRGGRGELGQRGLCSGRDRNPTGLAQPEATWQMQPGTRSLKGGCKEDLRACRRTPSPGGGEKVMGQPWLGSPHPPWV